MNFISAQPDSDYYIWQLQVQMNNFKKFGYDKEAIIVFAYDGDINKNALKFAGSTEARVVFYPDKRKNKSYIPSVRPHVLKQFFSEKPILSDLWMYHDSDIIFLDQLDTTSMNDGFDCVYVSNSGTQSYLDSTYINSKSDWLFKAMCDKVGIDKGYVEESDPMVGGAQYIFNFTPSDLFWNKIERDSNSLWELMTEGRYPHDVRNAQIELNDAISRKAPQSETQRLHSISHPIQAWTADMWAILWNIWLGTSVTRVHSELDFCWPTDTISRKKKILHNAGVDGRRSELFYKQSFIDKSPFGCNFDSISREYCSSLYVNEILKTSVRI